MMEMESTADAQMMQDALPNSTTTANNNTSDAVYQGSDTAADAADAAAAAAAAHRRGYQACDPCRKRKVKCDLGSAFDLL